MNLQKKREYFWKNIWCELCMPTYLSQLYTVFSTLRPAGLIINGSYYSTGLNVENTVLSGWNLASGLKVEKIAKTVSNVRLAKNLVLFFFLCSSHYYLELCCFICRTESLHTQTVLLWVLYLRQIFGESGIDNLHIHMVHF